MDQNFLLTSRFVSSLFSIATVIFIFLCAKMLFNKKTAFYAGFIYTFIPGSIQHAHFNTTESILIFLLSAIIYFSLKLYKKFSTSTLIFLSVLCGLAIATKITGALFLIIPSLAFLSLIIKKNITKTFIAGVLFSIICLFVFVFASPYQLIDWQQFYSEQNYMQGVILGKSKPPFTIIYENTLPYIYPFLFVMPFIFGFITLPLSIIGLLLLLKKLVKQKYKQYILLFVLVFPLVYFAWSGAWYAKFSRYYLLFTPFISLWAAYALGKIKKPLASAFLILIALNGVLFLKIYLFPNTRIAASHWINMNIPSETTIAGEHWDDNLPLPLSNTYNPPYNRVQLEVYNPDTQEKIETLSGTLSQSDYFIISSRRVSHSIMVNRDQYPYTSNLYSKLDSGELGFVLVKTFTNYPYFFSDDIADESFQSYDHPPVLIYKNAKRLTSQEIFQRLYE